MMRMNNLTQNHGVPFNFGICDMKKFTLDPKFFTDVSIRKEWGMYDHKETLTDDELVAILKGEDRCSTTSSNDHPEFNKLRNQLEKLGYIRIDRRCWNGDKVVKPFKLNGALFEKGEQFPCAFPCGTTVEYKFKQENDMKRSGKR